jgi:hypothetical protein
MGILGITPAEPGEVSPARGRAAERILAAELLAAFRAHAQTMTEFAERLQGRLVNHVLEVATCVFDSSATPVARQWKAAAGCVEVSNFSAAGVLTVHAAGPTGSAPSSGVGVYRVPAGATRVVAVASRQVTFYGAAGDAFSFQAFTAAPTPAVI